MKWHLLAHDGTIVRTCTATDKPTAQSILGPGPVVSAISYSLDSRYTPVDSPNVRPEREIKGPEDSYALKPRTGEAIPEGYLTTRQVAQHIGATPNQVRRYAEHMGLVPLRIHLDTRRRFFWSPNQIRRIAKLYYDRPLPEQTTQAIHNRRESYLATIRQRYIQRSIERGNRRREAQCSARYSSV